MDGPRPQLTPAHARERVARACRRTLACTAIFLAICAASSVPAQAAARSELAVLRGQQSKLERQLVSIQTQMLHSQQSYDEVEDERDRALALLMDHIVRAYRRRDDGGTLEALLASRNLSDAIDRARLLSQLTSYERRLLDQLDSAEERARTGLEQTDLLADDLVATQRRLDALNAKIQARVASRAKRAQRAPRPAADSNSQLASFSTKGTPIDPSLVFGAGLGGGSSAVPVAGGVTGSIPPGASASSIDAYLMIKGSPMAGSGVFFVASGQRWGIDPRLLVAIAGAESNFGQLTCGPFNAWGWSCPGSPASFGSWADGIETVTEGLRRYYVDEGRTSVASIQQKYAPSGASNDPTGLNNHWTQNVSRFLFELGGDPARIAG